MINLSDNDCYALRRACVGMPVDDASISGGVSMLIKACAGDIPRLIQAIDGAGALAKVMKFDPNAPAPAQKSNQVYIPELPKSAQLSPNALAQMENVGHWWRQTVAWCVSRSPMTPVSFFESGVVWVIALMIARRVYIEKHERIFPHLYLLFVAETSRFAKSTGMNTLYHLVHKVAPYMLIPGQTSPEGMMELLSGQHPSNFDKLSVDDKKLIEDGIRFAAQRGFILDEMSSLFASQKKDYMAGYVELLMRIYDGREMETHYTRSGGLIMVKKPALSIMGATTPAAMARSMTLEDWENGANARYLIYYREEELPYNPLYTPVDPPADIVNPLHHLHDRFEYDSAVSASMTQEALKAYDAYAKAVMYEMLDDVDERLLGNYRRMHIQVLKTALSLATMDWITTKLPRPEITLGHWALAQTIVEKARLSLHRLMPKLMESRDARTQRDILSVLKQFPAGITLRDLTRLSGRVSTKDIRTALEVLLESGQIENTPKSGATGRPTSIYKLVGGA